VPSTHAGRVSSWSGAWRPRDPDLRERLRRAGWIVYKDKIHKTTYVEAVAAPKGKWDFVAAPHTSKIASIRTAAGISIPTVEAGIVAAKAKKFTIQYKVQLARGESSPLEQATRTGTTPVEIARLRSAKGSVKWTPSTLIASPQRLILAVIKQGRTTVSVQRVTAINLKAVGKTSKKPVKEKGK
jgi:hypothetical protein